MTIRISKPDLKIEQQIHQAGIGLINIFGEDLFRFIDKELSISRGPRWLLDIQKSDFRYQSGNFKDPSVLLKDIIRNSSSLFREPLRKIVPQKESVAFYSRLQVILDDRNEWVHHQVIATEENLKTLALNISPIARKLSLETLEECNFIIDIISPEISTLQDDASDQSVSEELPIFEVNELVTNISEEGWTIGDRIDENFLDFSYTLLLSGSVKDRKSGSLLEEVNESFGKNVSQMLLERKPSGGRLRITSGGIIAGYFDEHWGYIAQVTDTEWFPSHLN
jgi:hypothetical protein